MVHLVLPVKRITVVDSFLVDCLLEEAGQHDVVWSISVLQALQVVQKLMKVWWKIFQKGLVVILILHLSHLTPVQALASPRKLPTDKLYHRVEQRPQVIMPACNYSNKYST